MKKSLCFVAVLILMVSPVLAFTSNVTVVSDDEISGGILKIKNPSSGELGDPIYPSDMEKKAVGIIVFTIETSLAEVELNLRLISNGEVIFNDDEGPYQMNKDITIDLREGAGEIEAMAEVVEEEVVEMNENETVEEVVNENIEEIVQKEVDSDKNETVVEEGGLGWFTGFVSKVKGLTGFSVNEGDSKNSSGGVLFFVFAGVLIAGLFVFLIVKGAYRSGMKAERKARAFEELDSKIDSLD